MGQSIQVGTQKGQLFLTLTQCISQFSKHRMWSCCPQGSAAPGAGVTSRWLWEEIGSDPCTPGPPRRSPSWAGGWWTPVWKTSGRCDSSCPAGEKGRRLWTLRWEGSCGHGHQQPQSHSSTPLYSCSDLTRSTLPFPHSFIPLKATSHRSVASYQLSPPCQKHCLNTC